MSDPDPDGCVDCDGYTPAEFEVATGYDVIAGEVCVTAEKVCARHYTARQLTAMAADERNPGAPDVFVDTR